MKRESCVRQRVILDVVGLLLVLGFVASLSTPAAAQYCKACIIFPVDYPGALATECNDFQDLQSPFDGGIIVGDYTDTSNVVHGFSYSVPKRTFAKLDYPGASMTYAWGVNHHKQIVGYFVDSTNNSHGFVYLPGITRNTFSSLDYPGGIGTFAFGINDHGEIVGAYFDSSGNKHGFTFFRGSYTSFDISGAIATNAVGVTNSGNIVGHFFDSSDVQHGFRLVGGIGGTFTQIDYPGSACLRTASSVTCTSVVREINNPKNPDPFDPVVGLYADAQGTIHGFGLISPPAGPIFEMLDVNMFLSLIHI